MASAPHTEAAFESAIELDLLAKDYVTMDRAGFDPHRAIVPDVALDFIRETQPKEWANLDALRAVSDADNRVVDEAPRRPHRCRRDGQNQGSNLRE